MALCLLTGKTLPCYSTLNMFATQSDHQMFGTCLDVTLH